MDLSRQELAEVLTAESLKVPAETGIFAGARFLLSVKICGEMELVTVTCKGKPYPKNIGRGRTALYVDVYGYGVRKSVNITKLRERPARGN